MAHNILFRALSSKTYDIVHKVYLHGKNRADFIIEKQSVLVLNFARPGESNRSQTSSSAVAPPI